MPEQDKWADWLVRGRQRGLDEKQVRRMQRQLDRLRDRVVKDAKIKRGDRVLDVGAGTGLIAHEARRRVKDEGLVVATDISFDALVHCRPIPAVVGDVLALPFRDEQFDVVITRSVLIYLDDKAAGVRELYRVLKPKARISIFEPINEVWRVNAERLRDSGKYDEFQPTHDKILDHYRSSRSSTLLGWDERDLLLWFEEAGFSEVELKYEHTSNRPAPPKRITDRDRAVLAAQWTMRPNPHDPSFEELVRTLLGEEADEYLARYAEFLLTQPPPSAAGVAYLTARR